MSVPSLERPATPRGLRRWFPARLTLDVFDALLPQTCAACKAALPGWCGLLCPACATETATAQALPYCRRCARTVAEVSQHETDCAFCRSERQWTFAGVARVGPHEGALRELVLDVKFRGQERAADELARLLAESIRQAPWAGEIDSLTPVPMHWLRRLQRPAHHTRMIAERVSQRLRLPLAAAVKRRVNAPSQMRMSSRAERLKNVAGVFVPAPRGPVQGKSICVIDNLLVTGATAHETRKVLRRAGAKRVYLAIITRSIMPGDRQAESAALAGAAAPVDAPPDAAPPSFTTAPEAPA